MRVTLPELYGKQYDAFFNDAPVGVCEATTKGGKTVGALVWQTSKALKDTLALNHWWVAPFHTQANIAYTRAKRMLDGVYAKCNDTDKCITLYNGVRWWFKAAEKPDTLYGEDVGTCVLDEYTRMREEAFHAVISTLTATEGQLRVIGNVKGRGWGYTLAREAERGEDGMVYTKITADDAVEAGVLSRKQIEFARKRLPHSVFRELYYCEPSDDGGNPFGIQAIEDCIGPKSDAPTVAYGIDLAKSSDYTAVIGFDAQRRWTFAAHFQMDWRTTKQKLVSIIGGTPALVDETGVGSPIVEDLQAECPNVEGFVFTPTSKQMLMEGIRNHVQDRECTLPGDDVCRGVFRSEMLSFEYQETRTGVKYSAPDRLHDDCVMSIGLGLRAVSKNVSLAPSLVTVTRRSNPIDRLYMGDDVRDRTVPVYRR